jgi:hypothetical protein
MIEQIAELNRVLIIANELLDPIKGLDQFELIDGCKREAIEARMPDHQTTIEFSIEIGMLSRKGKKKIYLTQLGQEFLDLNPDKLYDLSTEQKQYLIRGFFLDGALRKQVRDCLKCFAASDEKETFTWSEVDGTPFGDKTWVVAHMEQLGLITQITEGYVVNKSYVETIATFINEPKGYTEEQLLKWLEEKKRLGNFAEQLILNFEKERLEGLGNVVESKCVKYVGKLNTSAGYDIESFDSKSKGMKFDRFIEVKGSGDPKLRFVWSQNEMRVAEKLKHQYWIYYQGGIDKNTGKTKFKPIMIQDPFNSLDKDAKFIKTPNGVIVEGAMSGEKI